MQQIDQLRKLGEAEQKRMDNVVEILSAVTTRGEGVADIAHDARNMVTALDLYCDLLEEPGVLGRPYAHYGGELRLVAAASRRLVEKLQSIETPASAGSESNARTSPARVDPFRTTEQNPVQWKRIRPQPIRNLAEELLANRSLLVSLSGRSIALTIDTQGCAEPVRLTGEDLTRILVNLVKNAAEAMRGVGRIHISLWQSGGDEAEGRWLTLSVEYNGPGLSPRILDRIFEPQGAELKSEDVSIGSLHPHRGLGLSITRSIVNAAGGRIQAANRDPAGACFLIELPVERA